MTVEPWQVNSLLLALHNYALIGGAFVKVAAWLVVVLALKNLGTTVNTAKKD